MNFYDAYHNLLIENTWMEKEYLGRSIMSLNHTIDNILRDLKRAIREFKIVVFTGFILAFLLSIIGNLVVYITTSFASDRMLIMALIILTIFFHSF